MKVDFTNKTAILYARASTLEQSTTVQIKQLEEFCDKNQIKIIKKYSENVSGAAELREQLDTILNSPSQADLLIVREISRLSREEDYVAALEKIRELSKKYSIYILLDDYYIEKGKIIELADGITMLVKLYGAADERQKIKERTNTAVRKYKEDPRNVVSGKKQFGLKKVANPDFKKGINTRNIWIKDEEEWKIIEKIYDFRIKGYSIIKISQILNIKDCIVRQAFDSKVIKYYMEEEKLLKANEQKKKMTTIRSSTKHTNKYKGKIFFEGDRIVMCHVKYRDYFGYKTKNQISGIIREYIIDEVVSRTLRIVFEFFQIDKDELKIENQNKLNEIKDLKKGLNGSIKEDEKKIENLNRKYLKAGSSDLEDMILGEIERIKKEKECILGQLKQLELEEKSIKSIDYDSIKAEINQETLPLLIEKYISRVECYKIEKFNVIIRVYLKSGLLSNHWYQYKQWRVFNHRGYRIEPEEIEGNIGQIINSLGESWDIEN